MNTPTNEKHALRIQELTVAQPILKKRPDLTCKTTKV